jgi:hypothetical protein
VPLEFDIVELKMRDDATARRWQQKAAGHQPELCADKGATMEGDRKAREAAAKAVLDFLKKSFKA